MAKGASWGFPSRLNSYPGSQPWFTAESLQFSTRPHNCLADIDSTALVPHAITASERRFGALLRCECDVFCLRAKTTFRAWAGAWRALVRQWHKDFPAIHSEGGLPGSYSAGIVRERLVDVGEDPHKDQIDPEPRTSELHSPRGSVAPTSRDSGTGQDQTLDCAPTRPTTPVWI
ncbi:hypothetical protein DFH07DRAFT_783469 [Mycena maculata]|uniref:Uncharacterized protein n=1 Tax=Mycena maculata TaxID=230809 RepID=A0AAD7HML0_9AGAR|nr:hypothetical protein DFH07DRAFT_783469 [Mycena maculata]